MTTLLRSQIECPECGRLVASIHRHDFRSCFCGAVSLDGGRDYCRILSNVGWIDRSVRVEGDYNNQGARILLQAVKDAEEGKSIDHNPSWVVEELDRSGLIQLDEDSEEFRYTGPLLAAHPDA